LYWASDGGLVSCEGGRRRVSWRREGTERTLAATFGGQRLNSPNDLVLDAAGGIYFTDPRYGDRSDMEMDVEGVYYLAREGTLTRLVDDLVRPNGIVLSPDEKTLYVADQGAGLIWAYRVLEPGRVAEKRKFAELGSDGMSVDNAGHLYLTWAGSVIVLDSAGSEVDRLEFPEAPANCLLVGDTLYVTARTGFYCVRTNMQGLPGR
jgi:gluconolactonase